MRTRTVDLEAEAHQLRNEEIPDVEEAKQELVEKLQEEYDGFEEVPQEYRDAFDELESELVELRGQANALESVVDEWGDGVFVLTELSTGQIAAIQDRVSEKSFDYDAQRNEVEGTPKQGFGMVETLREAIVEAPDAAPKRDGRPEPANYPQQVGMYLFDKVNALNTTGEVEMGNSSLREAMSSNG